MPLSASCALDVNSEIDTYLEDDSDTEEKEYIEPIENGGIGL